jgi:hypothetical protein
LSADQGLAEAQFLYGVLLDGCDGLSMNNLLVAHYSKYAADDSNRTAQRPCEISQPETDLDEARSPLPGALQFNGNGGRPDQIDGDGAVAALKEGLRPCDQPVLSPLTNAMDAGLIIAELHYHLLFDEQTGDL